MKRSVLVLAKIAALFCAVLPTLANTAFSEPELTFRFFENVSEPTILDIDEVNAWGMNASSAIHFAADSLDPCKEEDVAERSKPRCASLRFALILPVLFLDSALVVTMHEYGHFRALSRMGVTDFRLQRLDNDKRESASPQKIFLLALPKSFTGGSIGDDYSASSSVKDWDEMISREPYASHRDEVEIFGKSGGFNQSQYAVEVLSSDVRRGAAHLLDGISYSYQMMSPAFYRQKENGDIKIYKKLLRNRGIAVSEREIQRETQLPKLASGSFLALAMDGFEYLYSGDHEVTPLSLKLGEFRVFWPEFASYLTVSGPTVKSSVFFDWDTPRATFSFLVENEKSYVAKARELTFGVRVETGSFTVSARGTESAYQGGVWEELFAAYRTPWHFTLGVLGYRGSGYTFAREVKGLIPYFVADKESGVKFFLEIPLSYRK